MDVLDIILPDKVDNGDIDNFLYEFPIIFVKIDDFLFEFMKDKPNKKYKTSKSIGTMREKIKEKFDYPEFLINRVLRRLILIGLIVRDYQDQCYYEHSLANRIKKYVDIIKTTASDEKGGDR